MVFEIQTPCQILLKRAPPICGIVDIRLTWLEIPQGQRPHLLCSHHVPASSPVLAINMCSTNISPTKVKIPQLPEFSHQEQYQQKEVKMFIVVYFCSPVGTTALCTWTQKTPVWKLEFWLMFSCNSEQIKHSQFSKAAIFPIGELTIQHLIGWYQAGVRGTK